jgi:hypothetical protein
MKEIIINQVVAGTIGRNTKRNTFCLFASTVLNNQRVVIFIFIDTNGINKGDVVG